MKKIISVFILLISIVSFAQQEKLEVSYTSRIILPDDFKFQPPGGGSRQMPKDIQEQMVKSLQEPQDFTLTILGEESLYKLVEKISNSQEQGMRGLRGGRMMLMNGDNIYKNTSTQQLLKEQNMMMKSYTIQDTLQNYEWKLTRETKTILGNEAKKATAIIDSIQTTAWYIPTLKYKTGPENYWGLPGLIAEVETEINRGPISGKRIISLTNISTATNTKSIEKPKDKNAISQKEYNKLMNDQRKRFEKMRNSGVNKRD
ncbi:GLPGLI family protein [Empedobacter stercoris]|uniref:GLPGLI family protein n=1 Tax=Empedobacter stercoris TaxID=1628248 RepID=UPI00166244D0|nr:GLPGLI family protein [Empedobacter stercoris]MCA4808510.1 GLPGLI family protein [Empedobacter stercoris]QNT13226.1 GLPGLI family protein [Empedobacter stercoris]